MNCIVCVASVPDTATVIKIGADGTSIDETGIKWIISPYDEYALEEALQLTEAKGGEVTVVTYGPAHAEATLRECLARGAHQAVHIVNGATSLGDSFTIAKVLAAAIKDRPHDLILCGFKGVGTDNGQVGQMVAELLDRPHVANVTQLEVGEGSLTAGREVEGGQEVVESPLPRKNQKVCGCSSTCRRSRKTSRPTRPRYRICLCFTRRSPWTKRGATRQKVTKRLRARG